MNLPPLVGHPQELAGTGALREAAQPLGGGGRVEGWGKGQEGVDLLAKQLWQGTAWG